MDVKLELFFKILALTMSSIGAFHDKRPLKSKFRTFLLHKAWPVFFDTMWVLMATSALLKMRQFANNRDWENLLDSIHILIIGIFTIYMLAVVQTLTPSIIIAIELIKNQFKTSGHAKFTDFYIVYILWFSMGIAYVLYIGGCMFYGEVLVPLWLPFIDNDVETTRQVFYSIWTTETVASWLIFCCFAIWGPFILVATICICKEICYLSMCLEQFKSVHTNKKIMPIVYGNTPKKNKITKPNVQDNSALPQYSETEVINFLGIVVEHHLVIKR